MKILTPADFLPFNPRDRDTLHSLRVWSRAFGGAHRGHRLGTVAEIRDVIDHVTGRFKTSHSWALQNQPRIRVVSDMVFDSIRLESRFKAPSLRRLCFSSSAGPRAHSCSTWLRAAALPSSGSNLFQRRRV
jgi:hypothetical protein